jgi:transposase InsO family protein
VLNGLGWLERMLRLACALYPRDFRTLLAADMAALYVREVERIAAHYNRVRPHSSLGYRPPAPEATLLKPASLRSAAFNNPLSATKY